MTVTRELDETQVTVVERTTITQFSSRGEFIPPHMVGAILNYFNEKCPSGGFLRAVLENDLMEAVRRADGTNIDILYVYVAFLHHCCPYDTYGSKEIVKAWLDSRVDLEDETDA